MAEVDGDVRRWRSVYGEVFDIFAFLALDERHGAESSRPPTAFNSVPAAVIPS